MVFLKILRKISHISLLFLSILISNAFAGGTPISELSESEREVRLNFIKVLIDVRKQNGETFAAQRNNHRDLIDTACEKGVPEARRMKLEELTDRDAQHVGRQYVYDVNLEEAHRLVKAWAEQGDYFAGKRYVRGNLFGLYGFNKLESHARKDCIEEWIIRKNAVARIHKFKACLNGDEIYPKSEKLAMELLFEWAMNGDSKARVVYLNELYLRKKYDQYFQCLKLWQDDEKDLYTFRSNLDVLEFRHCHIAAFYCSTILGLDANLPFHEVNRLLKKYCENASEIHDETNEKMLIAIGRYRKNLLIDWGQHAVNHTSRNNTVACKYLCYDLAEYPDENLKKTLTIWASQGYEWPQKVLFQQLLQQTYRAENPTREDEAREMVYGLMLKTLIIPWRMLYTQPKNWGDKLYH